MQIILSPAKLMKFDDRLEEIDGTEPLFHKETHDLISYCQELSIEDIGRLLKVNAKIAHDVYGYFNSFFFNNVPERSAAFAFNGIAYKGLDAKSLTLDQLKFAQSHFNIISGLYGVLRPLDLIKPYRLDVGSRVSPSEGFIMERMSSTYPKSTHLYGYWQEKVNEYLYGKLENDDGVLINLSSVEYFRMIVPKLLPNNLRVINIIFKELKDNKLKQIVVHAKKARGQMARFIVKNRIKDPEQLKEFNIDKYFYYAQESTANTFTFVR